MSRAFRIVLASLLLLVGAQCAYTQPNPPQSIDLAGIGIMNDMADSTFVAFSNSKGLAPAELPSLPFSKGTRQFSQFIPPSLVNATTIMKFILSNSSDSVQNVFFCPGFLFRSIDLYKMDESLSGSAGVS